MKNITLELTDYVVKGFSDLTLWGGEQGFIEMKSFHVKKLKEIKDNINDNGFGVQKINGAICNIYRNYQGTLHFAHTIIIGKVSDYTFNNAY